MSNPIYKSFMGRLTEAWYALSAEQQQALMASLAAEQKRFGVKSVVLCDSSWSSDRYTLFGVEEFPDMDALHGYHAALSKLNWLRYTDGISLIGTEWNGV
jgi:hypothetical protein